ncbi:radical SAM protein [candidate division FCPU426 bacterium]|nr:radical SAM protein [candidate division FCPU426 bacterium]
MSSMPADYRQLFNRQIRSVFFKGLRQVRGSGRLLWPMTKMLYRQWQAGGVRRQWAKRGLTIPPVLIASVNQTCNLTCQGCYAQALPRRTQPLLSLEEYHRLFKEAQSLGISISILAGGEPFLRPDLLAITRPFPRMLFVIFTNGTLLTTEVIRSLRRQTHVVPCLSLEGDMHCTDSRRGQGVFNQIQNQFPLLSRQGLFWGVSLTASRTSLPAITQADFIRHLLAQGCRLFFFVEYVPIQPGTDEDALTTDNQKFLYQFIDRSNRETKGIFIALPGNDRVFDGCLSSGRGFVHISPDGALEPCPFAPFSDISLRDHTLQEALNSPFLQRLRQEHGLLTETAGGCALWTRRDWAATLLKNKKNKI